MKRALIVEDEILAAKRLQRLLQEVEAGIEVLAVLDSVKEAARWLATNEPPDLVFMDIQLGDGLSFEIFDIVEVTCPVIFITAYNQYALEAFKVHSIAYLVKPVSAEDLQQALAKYDALDKMFSKSAQRKQVQQMQAEFTTGYKQRFLVKVGMHIKSVPVSEVAFFFSRHKATFLKTFAGEKYLLDYTLEQLTTMLDPQQFFRINRQYIVNLAAITEMVSIANSRIEVHLRQAEDNQVIVSRERVAAFKQWLDR